MDTPSPLLADDNVAGNGDINAATEEGTSAEIKNETSDSGATDTSTQPENSAEGSSSSGGEQGNNNENKTTPNLAESTATEPQETAAKTAPAPAVRAAPKPFIYDPNKITLKFLFANRDGLHVILDCTPTDTIGEVKGALLSLWPEDLATCSDGDRVRLICMGKGILMPDSKTLESLDIPVFKTHATPVNVAVRPEMVEINKSKISPLKKTSVASPSAARRGGNSYGSSGDGAERVPGAEASTGCSCVIL